MTHGALPNTVEVRTLAARGVVIEGGLTIARMPRLKAATDGADAPAAVHIDFQRDEEGRYIAVLDVSMQVKVPCQRCLDGMVIALSSHSALAAVWTDEQAQALPSRYDPLITEGETDLWRVVEDELLLSMPAFSYHDDVLCGIKTGVLTVSTEDEYVIDEPDKENPFKVLAALKADSKID